MSQQLSWARDGETLTLTGELDQDLLNPLWDARHNAMQGVTLIDLHVVTLAQLYNLPEDVLPR